MKFIHIADIHLGAQPDRGFPWSEERKKERYLSFQSIIKKCKELEVDLLLIAGDLFDKQPTINELKEINYLFQTLEKTKVVIIAGNHDYIGVRSNYLKFKWNHNVFFFLEAEFCTCYIEELNTEIYGFSYCTREIEEPKFHSILPKKDNRNHILLVHGGSLGYAPMDKNRMLQTDFDYIALGHIHKPEIFDNKMAYPGSLEPMDKTEVGTRGYILGEIKSNHEGKDSQEAYSISKTASNGNIDNKRKKEVRIEFIPSAIREYKRCSINIDKNWTFGEIKDKVEAVINENGRENIYIIDILGKRDSEMIIEEEDIYPLGNIVEVNNRTEPDYDYQLLYEENRDNIIGYYIEKVIDMATEQIENPISPEVQRAALYYGIEALLGAKTK